MYPVVLFVIEFRVNGNLLAPAMASGQKEGMAIAAAVAGLNVFVSFAVGFYALKNFHHVQSIRRNISKIGLTVYLIFITYLNWILGAYRSIHETTGTNLIDAIMGNENAAASTVTGSAPLPWTVDLSLPSLILVFLGIGFAIASLIDGYLFNDPYPGYGAVGKDRNENKKEINRIREHLSSEIRSIFNSETKKTSENRDMIISNVLRKDWIPNITSLENTFEGYRRFSEQISEALDHTVGEYRSVNSMFRTEAEPKYWRDDKGKVKTKYYELSEDKKDPNKVFRDFAVLYLNKDQIEKKIEDYQNKIQEEANEFINNINSYSDQTNKKIEEIRSKYAI